MKWLALLGLALLLAGLVCACVSFPQIEIGGEAFTVELGAIRAYLNLTPEYPLEGISAGQFSSFMAYVYREGWTAENLTGAETAAVWDFARHGYSSREMAPEQYTDFLANASATNADESICDSYTAVAYRDGFAGFAFSKYSGKTTECAEAPVPACAGGFYSPFANDLPAAEKGATPTPVPYAGSGVFPWEGLGGAGTQQAGALGNDSSRQDEASDGTDYLRYIGGAAAAVIVLAGLITFTIMTRRMGDQEPEFEGPEMHKALSSGTRVALLKELGQRSLTPTDLSTKVGKSKATIVEHLDRLIAAQLVEKIEEEGKKYVFYRLTPKGKAVLRRAG